MAISQKDAQKAEQDYLALAAQSGSVTARQFAHTELFRTKYGVTNGMANHYLEILQKATRNDSGEFGLYGWGGRPKDMFTKLSDFGGEFAQLGKDYANWISQMTKTNEEYGNYVKATQASPGRDQTILGGQGDQLTGTLLGSKAQTVFG